MSENRVYAEAPTAVVPQNVEVFPQIGQINPPIGIAYALDGKILICKSGGEIVLWDVDSRRELRRYDGYYFASSPDGRSLALSSAHGVRVIELSSGKEQFHTQNHAEQYLFYTNMGRLLALEANRADYTVAYFWDVTTGEKLSTLRGSTKLLSFAVSHDGRTAASGGFDGDIKLWDLASGREIRMLRDASPAAPTVYELAFSPNGRYLAYTLSGKGAEICGPFKVGVFETSSGRELINQRGFNDCRGWTRLAFTPDSSKLVFNGERYPQVVDIGSGRIHAASDKSFGSGVAGAGITVSPDGRTVAIGDGGTWAIRLWDWKDDREVARLGGNTESKNTVASIPGSSLVAMAGEFATNLNIWDGATGRLVSRIKEAHPGFLILAIAASPDGRLLATAGGDGAVRLWDPLTGKALASMKDGEGRLVDDLTFSADGRTIASVQHGNNPSGGQWAEIKIWDVAARKSIATLGGFAPSSNGIDSIAISPDGKVVATGDYKRILLWDVATGRQLGSLTAELTSSVASLRFTKDGKTLISVGYQNGIRFWDLATKSTVATLRGHADEVSPDKDGASRFEVSHDGKTLASIEDYGKIVLWDIATRQKIGVMYRKDWIKNIAFSADDRSLITVGMRGARIWDVKTRKERAALLSFMDDQWVAVTPDGYFVASEKGGQNLNVRIDGKVAGIDQYYERFFRPDLVSLALAGKSYSGEMTLGAVKPAPQIAIVDAPASTSAEQLSVKLRLTEQGGGIGDVRLYLNGSAVSLDNGRGITVVAKQGQSVERAYTVKLVSGVNTIKALAFNSDNSMQSMDAVHAVTASFTAGKPSFYALVIGINEFKNPKLQLKYPVADADLFASVLGKAASGLFGKTVIKKLVTAPETTRENIIKELGSFRTLGPDDLFVFYVASHGTVDDGEYFLITSNVGLTRTDRLKTDALPQSTLKELIANIPTTKKLIVLDTCNAGAMGDALQVAILTRGMSEDTAMKILSRAVGSTILSAATSLQEALEGYKGHGLFTYVLAEGLGGKADKGKSGYVKTTELADYVGDEVPALAEKVFKRAQYPTISISGQAFPIGKVK